MFLAHITERVKYICPAHFIHNCAHILKYTIHTYTHTHTHTHTWTCACGRQCNSNHQQSWHLPHCSAEKAEQCKPPCHLVIFGKSLLFVTCVRTGMTLEFTLQADATVVVKMMITSQDSVWRNDSHISLLVLSQGHWQQAFHKKCICLKKRLQVIITWYNDNKFIYIFHLILLRKINIRVTFNAVLPSCGVTVYKWND